MKTTWKMAFDKACENMEKAGQLPAILDYHLAPMQAEHVEIDTEELRIPLAHLDYGGSEGIYLTLHVFDAEHKRVGIGTFKTLEDDEESMEIIAQLYGKFINALYKWADEEV